MSRSWINQAQLPHLPLVCVTCGQHRAWRRQVAGIVDCRAGSTAIEQVLNAHADLIIFTELVLADHIDGGVAVDLASSKAGNAIQAIISASK